jgi:hypothetical protein
LETAASDTRRVATECEDCFDRLLQWIEAHEFARACNEGWLAVLAYQARIHPRLQRVQDYWHHWQRLRPENARFQYPSFERWEVAADTYTFEPQDG